MYTAIKFKGSDGIVCTVSSVMLYPRDRSTSLPKYGRFSVKQGKISNATVIMIRKEITSYRESTTMHLLQDVGLSPEQSLSIP